MGKRNQSYCLCCVTNNAVPLCVNMPHLGIISMQIYRQGTQSNGICHAVTRQAMKRTGRKKMQPANEI